MQQTGGLNCPSKFENDCALFNTAQYFLDNREQLVIRGNEFLLFVQSEFALLARSFVNFVIFKKKKKNCSYRSHQGSCRAFPFCFHVAVYCVLNEVPYFRCCIKPVAEKSLGGQPPLVGMNSHYKLLETPLTFALLIRCCWLDASVLYYFHCIIA